MNKLLLCLIISSLIFSSCKRKTSLFTGKKEKLEIIHPEFDYLTSKAKFKFDHDGKKVSATANFRIKKDSIIWLSVTPGLGLELARVLINKDYVFVLDKLNKKYYEYEFEELSDLYGFDFNYELIQSVILGTLAEPYDNQRISKSDAFFAFDVHKGHYHFSNFIGTRSQKLERVEVADDSTKNTISVNYGDFIMVDQEIFPNKISAVIDYESEKKPNTEINILYNRLSIEQIPLSFPFSVPSRYGRK